MFFKVPKSQLSFMGSLCDIDPLHKKRPPLDLGWQCRALVPNAQAICEGLLMLLRRNILYQSGGWDSQQSLFHTATFH